ncbi:MAG: putative transposase [Solirubrobacteraceae bacterium]|nr:putative transposase [Solirubrobacteraceae bacterium]
MLLDDGWALNRKRTQRLWREEGLRVPQRRRKRQRLGNSMVPADRLRAQAPDHVWALDFQFDQTADGRILKLLHVVDEFTREALTIECHRRIDADKTVATLERLVAERGSAPAFIRSDNGPELTANALRAWCRFACAGRAYIEPGSPWQNPYVESFGSRVRDELLSVELFSCLAEARVLIENWRQDYNQHRPHSALGMMAPARFAAGYREAHRAAARACACAWLTRIPPPAPGALPTRRSHRGHCASAKINDALANRGVLGSLGSSGEFRNPPKALGEGLWLPQEAG